MLKVQQTKRNQCFLEAAGDYLVANGYKKHESSYINGSIRFEKGDTAVIVYGDNVDFLTWNNGEAGQHKGGYSRFMAVTSIASLDIFKWMLLFHIADVVPLAQFIKEARKEETTAGGFTVKLYDHFRVNAVPINY
jgi:hypothetical protein